MATLLLGAAGSAVGGALFGPLGAVAGRALGALGGAMADSSLAGGGVGRTVEGPRLSDLDVMTSNAGAPVPRIYGRVRLAGQVIWGTRLEEVVSTRVQSGGKGVSRAASASTTTVSYAYHASFAVALCEGPVSRVGRIWADGKPLETDGIIVRAHLGHADQMPDPWIAAKQGAGQTPAYRGLAYLVFERLPLAKFGNRVPQISVEVERAIGTLEPTVRAVTLIPGASEFGYEPRAVKQVLGRGSYAPENRHGVTAPSDFAAALDQLQGLCPNLERVSLVVAWFGDDLRAGACTIRPKVERTNKATTLYGWAVNGLSRLAVQAVSSHEGRIAYGGTPSDISVVGALVALRARGLKVTLNPFLMMDIPASNARPDPWTGADTQPAYPWRGRITCDPAPERPGSPARTPAADAQIAALFGAARASDFLNFAGILFYLGAPDWGLRRMVLHYALLAQLAGGVEAFLIGSELAALTRVRGAEDGFPAVAALTRLAGDVKAILGAATRVSYGADWTEYGAQVFADGDVRFPLDALWAAPAVDFVGIDYYPPISDWRDGPDHLDAAIAPALHDSGYLKDNLRGGEGFDWYYPDEAARRVQARVPITDGAFGEPWIFRQKDLWSWWGLPHHERIAGVRSTSPTAWVPGSKPLRLTEAGCPAVDKGTNRPSVFPDAKSSAGGYPPFSNRQRDDFLQRRALETLLVTFDASAGASLADNPAAPLYGGRMVEPGCVFLWTWDARPYPVFPLATDVWADGANWATGHWLTGRLGAAPLSDLVARVCADHGVFGIDSRALTGVVDGYLVDRPMSARSALDPLARAFAFDAREEEGHIAFRPRGGGVRAHLGEDDLVSNDGAPPLALVRTEESELPLEVAISFMDPAGDYRTAQVASRRLVGASRHVARAELALVAPVNAMAQAADVWLQDLWAGRETATFAVPHTRLTLAPGDVVSVTSGGRARLLEILRIEDAEARAITARTIEPEVFQAQLPALEPAPVRLPAAFGPPEVVVLDLPLIAAADPVPLQHIAAVAAPWPGTLAVWRSTDGASFAPVAALSAAATLADLLDPLAPGPLWRFDRSSRLRVSLEGGHLSSASETEVLDGANTLALLAEGRAVELIQFTEAELLAGNVLALSGLLRGQAGTEAAGADPWPAGTRALLLNGAVVPVAQGLSAYGRAVRYRVGPADGDHGDERVQEVAATIGGAALLPLAPVHLAARRGPSGIDLSWVRRTRFDAAFDVAEVPLGEDIEAYRVEICDGAAMRRVIETSTPRATYSAADELADFGAPCTALTFRVAQMSAALGPGRFAQATRPL